MQRSILQVKQCQNASTKSSVDAFIEEAVVRRELADNFCFYNPKYDSVGGASAWAQETLRLHEGDQREHLYSPEQFERAETHDDLWNAAQVTYLLLVINDDDIANSVWVLRVWLAVGTKGVASSGY